MPFDPLKLSSGLLDDDDVVIRDAIFRTDPEFRDGQVLFLDATLLDSNGEETNQFFGTGNGWETNDDGATAAREDGRDINFNGKAKIGELFGGLVKVMKEDGKADKAIRDRIKQHPLGPREAAFWKGLMVHVTAQDRKGGGEVDDYTALVIDGFNGIEGDAGKAKGATTKKATKAAGATKKAAAPKAEPTSDGATLDDLDPAIRAKLDEIADASDDHDAFMERAYTEVPEAGSDTLVRTIISDGGEGSLWAEAVARYQAANPAG